MTVSNTLLRLFLLAALTIAAAAVSSAQVKVQPMPAGGVITTPNRSLSDEALMAERARRAEAAADFNRALSIWQELANHSPWNSEAVLGIERVLLVMKKYDDAEAFLKDRIRKSDFRSGIVSPLDPTSKYSLELALGQVALSRGDEKKAWEIWNSALSEQGKTAETVRGLVSVLQQNRRWEDSEKLIRDFRKESHQPAFMAQELAMGLRGQMDYAGATEELLIYADNMQPTGWQLAMSYLDMFPDDSTVAPKVIAVLHKALQKDRKNAVLWRITADYLHKSGNPEESLDATIAADSLMKRSGTEVLTAAQQFLNEKEIAAARRGFQKVLSWQPEPDVAARAELGLGQCLEALDQWADAKKAYENFISIHTNSKEADEARLRIAEILLNRDHDAAAALEMYRALSVRPAPVPRGQVGLRIGDCLARMDQLDNAISAWSDVVRMNRTAMNEDATQALMRIAHADLWRDSVNQALDILDSIQTGNPMNSVFNEAVLYSGILGEGGFHGAIRVFAEGDYDDFCGRDSLAAERYDSAAALLKAGKLAEWARYSEALALRDSKQPRRAIAVLDTFIADYSGSVDLDRAEYLHAVIRMEDLHDDKGALTEFENFLAAHPRSIYLEEVRKKARMLTGKVS